MLSKSKVAKVPALPSCIGPGFMTFLFGRSRSAANARLIDRLNGAVVDAVRQPVFYEQGGVADTFNGRFEMLVLHAALLVRRLRALPAPGPAVAQDLIDTIFRNLDPAMRELGVGDMAVPKRMKRLAEAFLGRAIAYENGLKEPDDRELAAALSRNVLGGTGPAAALARYARDAARTLDDADLNALLSGSVPFPDPSHYLVPSAV